MNLYRAYLMSMLKLGFVDHVYSMTDGWGNNSMQCGKLKCDAAWAASEKLVDDYGYHSCPGCNWAVKDENEHLTPGSYCSDQVAEDTKEERLRQAERDMAGYDPTLPWDMQEDGVSAFHALPDREHHKMFH